MNERQPEEFNSFLYDQDLERKRTARHLLSRLDYDYPDLRKDCLIITLAGLISLATVTIPPNLIEPIQEIYRDYLAGIDIMHDNIKEEMQESLVWKR